jgi:hypothetical protein
LPNTVEVAASGDFLDKHWCETLASKLLVDSEEVDLRTSDYVIANTQVNRDGGNESAEQTRLRSAHADMILLLPARRHHGPVRVSVSCSKMLI